jgi:hypothetical protein
MAKIINYKNNIQPDFYQFRIHTSDSEIQMLKMICAKVWNIYHGHNETFSITETALAEALCHTISECRHGIETPTIVTTPWELPD